MNYKILSKHFRYSNPGEYKEFYTGKEHKTNTEISDIYKANKGDADIDLMLIEDLTYENEIQLNPEYTYACFVKEIDNTYILLKPIITATNYNNCIVNFNGDVSKLVFARIIENELSDKRWRDIHKVIFQF